jgi:hypothetical protein
MATINIKTEDVEGVLSLTEQVAIDTLLEKNGKLRTPCIVNIDLPNNQIIVGNRVYAMDAYQDSLPSLQLVLASNTDSPMPDSTPSEGLPRRLLPRIMSELPNYHKDFQFEHQPDCSISPAVDLDGPLFQRLGTPYPYGMLPPPALNGMAPQCSTHPWVHTQITVDKEIKRVKLFSSMDCHSSIGDCARNDEGP